MSKKILIIFVMSLTGCATQIATIKQADDAIINTWITTGCATPLSAVLRHPEIIPALQTLCQGADTKWLK